jgi:predicted nucleic acid-binding protein
MSRFLLDTDILIDFSKGREPAFSFVHRAIAHRDDLGVTPINVAEFYAGLRPEDIPTWDAFFEPLEFWPLSREAAKQAGRWRYDFARRGQSLPTTDTLVAAVALQHRAVIVTNNVADYPMPSVELLALKR